MKLVVVLLSLLLIACGGSATPVPSTPSNTAGVQPTVQSTDQHPSAPPTIERGVASDVSGLSPAPTPAESTPPLEATPAPTLLVAEAATIPPAVPVVQPVPVSDAPPQVTRTAIQEYAVWCQDHEEKWEIIREAITTWGEAADAFKQAQADHLAVVASVELRDFHLTKTKFLEASYSFADEQDSSEPYSPFALLLHEPMLLTIVAATAAESALSDEVRDELVRTGCLSGDAEVEPIPTSTPTPEPDRLEVLEYLDPLTDETVIYFTLRSDVYTGEWSDDYYHLVLAAECSGSIILYVDVDVYAAYSAGDLQELMLRFGGDDHYTEAWEWVGTDPDMPEFLTPVLLQAPEEKTKAYIARVLIGDQFLVRFPGWSNVEERTLVFQSDGLKSHVEQNLAAACS